MEDQANRDFLAADPKTRAEDLMILVLLCNDLSQVCQPSCLTVPELFTVETYATLHRMTSAIERHLKPNISLTALFKVLFICGLIIGAPKLWAMEILCDVEPWPSDIYCGTIG